MKKTIVKNSLKKESIFWYYLLVALFLILYLSELLEQSMFIDGVWYAVISNNLAEGIGSFWQPQFSSTIFSSFHEHPPLAFGFQALFFRVFGNHFWTERLFSLLIYVLSFGVIISLWRQATKADNQTRKMWYLAIIFWQANIVSYFFLPANLLDTPLAFLDAFAIYSLLLSTRKPTINFHLLAAAFVLFLAVLTKGLVGLFPLAFLLFHYFIFKPYSFSIALKRTGLLISSLLLFFGILFLAVPESWTSIQQYLDVQLLASLNGERRLYYFQNNRFFIVGQLAWTLTPMFLFLLAVSIFCKILKLKTAIDHSQNRYAWLFFWVGLSASLPIMISPRQALPYLIPSLPYFSLAVGLWSASKVQSAMDYISNLSFNWLRVMEGFALSLCIFGMVLSVQKYGQSNQRDYGVIQDAKTIGVLVGQKNTVASTSYNMYISGYLMRFNQINLDTQSYNHSYLITPKNAPLNDPNFKQIERHTYDYLIYKNQNKSVLGASLK